MEICRYCNEIMMRMDNFNFSGISIAMYVCKNEDCKAVYERCQNDNSKSKWFNPKTKKYEI